ncbi:MAG: hypothetical protein ACYC1K_02040 [Minisyncoccota bacterium]
MLLLKILAALVAAWLITGWTDTITERLNKELTMLAKSWLARKHAELASVQARIREFESSITEMTADIQSMDRAADYGTAEWRARREKRLAGVNNDRHRLNLLQDKEEALIRELGIEK